MKLNGLYHSKGYIFSILLFLFLVFGVTFPLQAQRGYYGNLSNFNRSIQDAIEQFYTMSMDCVIDEQNRSALVYGIEKNFLYSKGVYVPDYISYKGIDAIVSYTNYIDTFLKTYGKRLKPDSDISANLGDIKILKAYWTDDSNGVILNVVYDVDWSLDGKSVYKSRSQAVACFPDYRDLIFCRLDQVTPYGWNPEEIALNSNNASPDDDWFERAIGYYRAREYDKSFPLFKQKAAEGEPDAWGFLGNHYYKGRGTKKDTIKARECYIKTHQYDTPMCKYFQSLDYLEGSNGFKKDTVKAFRLAQESAKYGYPEAQTNLGYIYWIKGVYQDYTKAIEWFRKAAEQGYALAQFNLGNSYYNGEGVPKDYSKAIEWYRKAAKQGYDWAQTSLGLCYELGIGVPKDYFKAVELYHKSAEQGNATSQLLLGLCYYNGNGTPKDFTKAVEWYRKAAEQGNVYAQNALGNCYYNGEGVPQNYAKAVEWYRKAAKQGYVDAQYNLGNRYYYGEGVSKDYAKAVEWYQKSAEQGDADAQNNLGNRYYLGEGVSKDYVKAVEWYQKSAEQGNAYAQANLGNCYYYGEGVSKDITKAVEWFRKAAEQGNMYAIEALKRLETQ